MNKLGKCMVLLAVVGLFLVLNAVSPTAEEPIELRLTWWGSQQRHDLTIEVIELFQQKYPHIKVVYEFSGWRDYFTKLTTQAAGGNLPDIMQHDYARIAEWVSNGLLLPLDEYVASGTLDLSHVSESVLEGGKVDGKLYGVTLGTNSLGMILDVEAFQKAGIDLPAQNWTWEDYEQVALALHEKLGMWGGGGTLADHNIWKSLYLGYGQNNYSADGKSLGYTDDQPLMNHMSMLVRLIDAGAYIPRDIELAEYFTTGPEGSALVQGKAAMVAYWSNQLAAIWKAAGEDRNLAIVHLPRPKDGCCSSNYIKPSMFFSLTKDAKHPKEAAMFIDFFVNSVEAGQILLADRGVPISSVVRNGIKETLSKAEQEAFAFLERVETDGSPLPPADPAAHSDVYNNVYLPEFADPVLLKEISPEEGVANLRTMATPILSK